MINSLNEILICPFDKYPNLELLEFKVKMDNSKNIMNFSKMVSGLGTKLEKLPDNKTRIIEEGLLFCNGCFRFYPIIDEIPIILPDNLRDKDLEMSFLKRWQNLLPDKIVKQAVPWHL